VTGRSGQNFNVVAGGDFAETGNAATYERANRIADPYQSGPVAANPQCIAPSGPTRTKSQWFNPCAFASPAFGTLGTNGRNNLQAERFWNLDSSVSREFPLHDTLRMGIKVEAFNTFNHPVLNTPGANTATPSSLGIVTSVATGNANRILQFSGRISF
jgi:hypothetical protein